MRINIFHKLFLLSFLLFPLFAQADPCTVGKIAVIPGSWENTSTKTSLTVQAQTSAGESCHVPKTLKLSFSSTASGSFTAQGGGAIQAYISASDANRNFYYTHSAGENYTLTINADYGTASEWSTQFTTTYTSGSSGTSTTTEEEVPPTESEESSGSSSSSSSSHHSATPLSTLTSTSKFKVGAGRERLTHIGTPIELRAEVSGEESNKINFTWSLGDGSVLVGETVNHTYVFPGEYHVVLNATTREGVEAVSRTKVRVHSAEVSITSVTQERIEVTNNSPEEMNLYGRALVMQDRSFIFPKDTIVSARGRISFPSSVTKLSPQSPDDVFLLSHGQSIPTDLFARESQRKMEEIRAVEEKIASLQLELARVQSETKVSVSPPPSPPPPPPSPNPEVVEPVTQTANALSALPFTPTTTAVKVEVRPSWLDTLKRFFLGR